MTNDEFLDDLPWYQGLAWAALSGDPLHEVHAIGSKLFWLAPRYFALMHLARQYPDEYARLAAEAERNSAVRYNRKDWAREEPFPTVDVKEALRAYVKRLEEENNADSTVTSD